MGSKGRVNDRMFRVAAQAHGTLVCDVEAASFAEAVQLAAEQPVDWRLADEPEPGDIVSVLHLESGVEREVDENGEINENGEIKDA